MIPDPSTLAVFTAAALLLLVVPGPAVLYIVARCIDQGRMAGFVSILGISVGTLFHVAAAAFGLSAILVSSALAFNVVKYLGAAYLIYLGIQKLTSRDDAEQPQATEPAALSKIFYEGMIVNLLNPKTALFFFAFLPQFVDVSQGSIAGQILVLGFLFVILAVVTDSAYAVLANTLADWLKARPGFFRGQRYFAGTVFIALGVATAFSGSGKNK
ncbi:MAG: LysE family translocator [Acidobacteriota bacterium]